MPRPEQKWITFSIDGREVKAPENAMLVDGAKYGDVEIPVFCYEPKLGQPVGACRMCLVEIEGMPKLQTACSTAVKDGMVVHTQTDRVKVAQKSVVEFLLINHPLDCPVCDKGGECPLQDITFGWGAGTSRFIEPKRHFKKPLELSPVVAIDRERCILCYRCVRFSQEIAEDYQLILEERGAHSYVATFDGHPYVAPFSGNIIELCPVGALTSTAYRFRARPWDIEGSGSICTMCPAQCNIEFTVRDDKVMRVLSRDNTEVDDGWLCDKGRFGYQYISVDERITQPLVREGTDLMPASWEKALSAAQSALSKADGKVAALAAGETTNEEAFLLARLLRERLGSSDLSARPPGRLSVDLLRQLANPALQATVSDLEFANSVLVLDCEPIDDAPVFDLRIRKGVRRNNTKLHIATARPSILDARAHSVTRFVPGGGETLLTALAAALDDNKGEVKSAAHAGSLETVITHDPDNAGANSTHSDRNPVDDLIALANALRDSGDDVVIVFSERLLCGPRANQTAQALLNLASRLELDHDGAGLLQIPVSTNGRGLAEVGFASNHGAGYGEISEPGRDTHQIASALADGKLSTIYLLHADPLRTEPDRKAWERGLAKAQAVIAHEAVLTETVKKYATVVFPAEAYAEKEGTLVHPDGRVQRIRPAIGRPRTDPDVPGSGVRPEWQVIVTLAQQLGLDLEIPTGAVASQQIFDAVSFYADLTLDDIAGHGVRWQEREQAKELEVADWQPAQHQSIPADENPEGELLLGTYRSLWSSKEVDMSPSLHFARTRQVIELSPVDANRHEISDGDTVSLSSNGTSITGLAKVRASIPTGRVFAAVGVPDNSASVLTSATVKIARVNRLAA